MSSGEFNASSDGTYDMNVSSPSFLVGMAASAVAVIILLAMFWRIRMESKPPSEPTELEQTLQDPDGEGRSVP